MLKRICHYIIYNSGYPIKSNQTKSYIYLIYMNKQDLPLNNIQWWISHKTKLNQTIWYRCIKKICHEITYINWYANKLHQAKPYIYLIYIFKQDLPLNNLQCLICHRIKPTQIKPSQTPLVSLKNQKHSLLKRNWNRHLRVPNNKHSMYGRKISQSFA